jgi:hypothetical protein
MAHLRPDSRPSQRKKTQLDNSTLLGSVVTRLQPGLSANNLQSYTSVYYCFRLVDENLTAQSFSSTPNCIGDAVLRSRALLPLLR